jgi:hypothetical protein
MSVRLSSCAAALCAAIAAAHSAGAAEPKFQDADTRAWWRLTAQLSDDSMEGRDTGSPAYARAAKIVADRFAAAGLKPAGDNGSFFQSVPLHEVRIDAAGARIAVARDGGAPVELRFLHQVTVRPTDDLPQTLDAPLVFRGYCSAAEMGDARGKVVICFGTRRNGLPSAADRLRAASAAGAAGLINVDDPGFTIEPPRWPVAYARSVSLRDAPPPPAAALPVMSLSAEAFPVVIAGSGHEAATILADGAAKRALPSFDIPARLQARFPTVKADYASDNVLALLPGTDPKLAKEVVVISAHLDGYGYGEPVGGERIYHGTYDDAAYVATLVRFAERHHGAGLRRTVLLAAFTGEEKGLLGSTWFTRHPTVPTDELAADINLDQLRPLFPLKILTVEGLGETTLGETARTVANGMGVEVRPDLEPERNLVRRADHWPFMQIGVPAVGFVFGYDPGTEAESRYRDWYTVRYHRPQDSLATPIDPKAAADFNRFFYTLTEAVADAPERPAWLPTATLGPVAAK